MLALTFSIIRKPSSLSSHAHRVQIGKFLLDDGKVVTLSRKSSPSRNCVPPGEDQPCGLLDWCCEGLKCDGYGDGRCRPDPNCRALGVQCTLLSSGCCYPYHCSDINLGSTCVE
ncbi:hypothetical protein Tco_0756522 [Tanacetum coccineum]